MSQAGHRRNDMQGLQFGVDSLASTRLLRSTGKDQVHKGILRSILAGAINYGHRLFRAGIWDSDVCPFCGCCEPETLEHMFWRCPAWREERFKHSLATSAWRQDWPACFSCCGILSDGVIIDADSVDWVGPSVPVVPPVVVATGTGTTHGSFEGGAVVIYTDGACIYNQIPSLRRAGVGVWWGDGHADNYSAPLPGQVTRGPNLLLLFTPLKMSSGLRTSNLTVPMWSTVVPNIVMHGLLCIGMQLC